MIGIRVLALCLTFAAGAQAETLRVATYDVDLSRDGPGVLLDELSRKPGDRARAAVAVIQAARPDVLVIQRFDHDLRGRALDAFVALLAEGERGIAYPYRFADGVNAGVPSGLDLDGDGSTMDWNDALGWGKYPGHGGMAILSRFPLGPARTFRALIWRDAPGAVLPTRPDGSAFFAESALAALPLSSRSHWDVPVALPEGGTLRILTSHPTPPLFDGPEGLNRLRNRDEIGFWTNYLDGFAYPDDQGGRGGAAAGPLVVLGDFNLDPDDGAGDREAIRRLLSHPRLQDPEPTSDGAAEAAAQGDANARHVGRAALDTVDWRDDPGPGNLRTSYVLPSIDIEVEGAGVFWPSRDDPQGDLLAKGPPHRLVWADLTTP